MYIKVLAYNDEIKAAYKFRSYQVLNFTEFYTLRDWNN